MDRIASSRWALVTTVVLASFASRDARAGGMEFPDNGTQALGRGAAFTARADDGTALLYNVAGLAKQRGTRLLFNSNLTMHDLTFRRSGTYPDDPNRALTPWGGRAYAPVSDVGPPFFAPLAVLTSDFGLDRATFAIGAYGPSTIGNRAYPIVVDGLPSSSRYDTAVSGGTIVFPTAAAAFRLFPWLDVGAAFHLTYARFSTLSVSLADVSPALCPNPEYQPCDSRLDLKTDGIAPAGSFGLMAHPVRWLDLGANVRTGVKLETEGVAESTPPLVAPNPIDPSAARFTTKLPWVIRTGARLVKREGRTERADVELDFVYEAWSGALGDGAKVQIDQLSLFKDIRPTIRFGYRDTWSLRAGGSWVFDVGEGQLAVRAGAYYDSSATASADTRVNFDTLAKVGLTAGAGIRVGALTFNVAYAEVFSFSRDVADGAIRPINGAKNGTSESSSGTIYPAVNDGKYDAHARVLSLGASIAFDEFFGKPRMSSWGEPEGEPESAPEGTPTTSP
ncbi:MAG: outer membrane protein transport protein [Polyangiaceae bacterium]